MGKVRSVYPRMRKTQQSNILKNSFASVRLLRNTLRVNLVQVTQLLCWLENEGYIAPSEGEFHKVLITKEQYEELLEKGFIG